MNRFYKGLIDEVKVWNCPLTAEELKRSQLQPSPVDATEKLTIIWGTLKTTPQ